MPKTLIPTYALDLGPLSCREQLTMRESGPEPKLLRRAEFLAPHRKDYYLLVLVRRGGGRHWVDMRPYDLQPDTLYFTTPRQVHLKEQALPFTGTVLAFAPEFLPCGPLAGALQLPVLINPANGHDLPLALADLAFVETTLQRMLAEYRQQRPWRTELLRADLHTLLVYLSRSYEARYGIARQADDALLARFTALLNEHYAARHQVAHYADLLHLTPGHLNARLKQLTGQSALALIRARLVVEARRLLFYTDLSMAEVAFTLGFEDPSYFGRFFRQDTGQTPVAYRTKIREMYQKHPVLSD